MFNILECTANMCRYALTDDKPHFFCGETTNEGQSYCPTHYRLCYGGPGKDWQALAGMMTATERHVVKVRSGRHGVDGHGLTHPSVVRQPDNTAPVDEMIEKGRE